MEKRTSIRVPDDLAKVIQDLAKEEGRSWSSQIVQLAREAIRIRAEK